MKSTNDQKKTMTDQELNKAIGSAKANDNVTVFYNLAGREYTNKNTGQPDVFVTLRAWKVQIDSSAPTAPAPMPNPQADENGDLPF